MLPIHRIFLSMACLLAVHAFGQSNPVPLLSGPLSPPSAASANPDLTITLNGAGFVPGSVVRWNNSSLSTTFLSGSRLRATVPSSATAVAGTASVSVFNPTPGGGVSNVVYFPVHSPVTALAFTTYPHGLYGRLANLSTTADFNGDGRLDIAGIGPNTPGNPGKTIFVALGNGDGSFADPQILNVGNHPVSIVAADFDGDGKLDLAVANQDDSTVSVLLGNGDGTFQSQKAFPSASASLIFAADFNRDGRLDIVTNGISLLVGNGDGTLQNPIDVTAGVVFSAFGLGDFNGDGNIDLVAAAGSQLSVFLGNGDGAFQAQLVTTDSIPGNCVLNNMVVADLNGDNLPDLEIGSSNCNSYTLSGNGDGSFTSAVHSMCCFPWEVADFNGDGTADILVGSAGMEIGLGGPNGSFQDVAVPGYYSAIVGDFNGDGLLDFADSGGNLANYAYAVELQGSYQDFTLSESVSSLSLSPGVNNHLGLSVSPVGGFTQTVNLSCSGAPAGVTCALSPSSITLDGTTAQNIAVNLSVASNSRTTTELPNGFPPEGLGMPFAFGALVMFIAFTVHSARSLRYRPSMLRLVFAAALLCLGIAMVGCSRGKSGGGGAVSVTPGPYTLTLSGSAISGSITLIHSTQLMLNLTN